MPNHRDTVMAYHLPSGQPGSVAKARPGGQGSYLCRHLRGREVLVKLTVNSADMDRSAVAELMAGVAAAVARRVAAVSEDVYQVILRDIPQLRDDKPVLALLASSVDSNVDTCLQIMQHQIDLADVQAPAAAVEYARRQAQRGTPLTALLRSYRLGHACFSDWLLRELARQADDAQMITAATLDMSKIVAGYIDQTSEEIVAAYTRERENWLRNRSAARAARIRGLLSGERIEVRAAEATLGYRLRQYHVGVVCWTGDAAASADNITRLDRAIREVAGQAACSGDPLFLPRDESSAWAWLPLGIRDRFDSAAASTVGADGDIHFAFGDAEKGTPGFRLTHQQAVAAQAVALAAGSARPRAVAFGEVAPVAMMLGSADLLRAWVLSTLAGLAADDEHHARLRDTLLVFLQAGGSYKTTAEQLMLHKNTVQYRIRKAQESLGRPVGDNRHDVELALQASQWLGSSVLQRPAVGHDREQAP
jgi:DNA-binding PucR family transcriptional regulator